MTTDDDASDGVECAICGSDVSPHGRFCSQECHQAAIRGWAQPCAVCSKMIEDPFTTAPAAFAPFCSSDCWSAYCRANARNAITVWCTDPSHADPKPDDLFHGASSLARFEYELLQDENRGGLPCLVRATRWAINSVAARQPVYLPQTGRLCGNGHEMQVERLGRHAQRAVCVRCNESFEAGEGPVTWLPLDDQRVMSEVIGSALHLRCPCGQEVRSKVHLLARHLDYLDRTLPPLERRVPLSAWRLLVTGSAA